MNRVPCVAIILGNSEGKVLLLLRDDKPTINFPNHWTLIGGKVEDGETPEMAAHRELEEETGLKTDLTFWKRYDRQHPHVIVDQYIYTGFTDAPHESLILGEGQELRFFKPEEIKQAKMAYKFDLLLEEYFQFHHP